MRLTNFVLLGLCAIAVRGWSPYHESHMEPGRSVIVQMFEWRFNDLAQECETFLGPRGYGGIQISPVHEYVVQVSPWFNKEVVRPWWERYQIVSYKIDSRSGTEEELKSMLKRCNNAGVRVIGDAVINHMTGTTPVRVGSAGTPFNSDTFDYPGVPYTKEHFNSKEKCGSEDGGITNFDDPWLSRNCELVGLHDLDQSIPHVREMIKNALNHLLDMGMAGFRVDATKHMWPEDLEAIFANLNNISTEFFPANKRPFLTHEVSESNRGPGLIRVEEYENVGRIEEFRYLGALQNILYKLNTSRLSDLRTFGHAWNFLPDDTAITFIDNHDVQRGHNGDFSKVITFRNVKLLTIATAYMLAWPYGTPKVFSSYFWEQKLVNGEDLNDWVGPPVNEDWSIKEVKINDDGTCGNGWICEHRWPVIANLVKFRNVAKDEPVVHWWDNSEEGQGNQIAFGRKGRAFFALNNEDTVLSDRIETGLSYGTYCDIISGELKDGACTGRKVHVNHFGYADIDVSPEWDVPILAIHIEAKEQ